MATLHFELVAPERVLFSGEVTSVLIPGTDGDMTVLPGHAPVMSTLKAGFVVATDHRDHGIRILVRGGFAEINPAGVTVLAERATPVEELSPEKLDHEILELGTIRDGSSDHREREKLDMMIGQLEEAKAALRV
ncbi:MAG: F0F1 ATP synthase subunit epsilon [Methylobacteriaceae bacterium]|nr:F0F1 ATP synthase subunit epsilon [Methylobacteriaceae bacterium]